MNKKEEHTIELRGLVGVIVGLIMLGFVMLMISLVFLILLAPLLLVGWIGWLIVGLV